jgi:2'-5' RNA ligase
MEEIIKYSEFIAESKKPDNKHSHGCMMLYIEVKSGLDKIFSKIKEKDLYTEKDDDSYGMEKESHITIKFGFTNKVSDHEVMDICRKEKFDKIKLNKISLFENEKFDVLKFDITNETLNKLNKKISKFENEDKYPDYNAHSTIAYLQKGKGAEYVEMFKKTNLVAVATKFVYSNIDDTKLILDIKK